MSLQDISPFTPNLGDFYFSNGTYPVRGQANGYDFFSTGTQAIYSCCIIGANNLSHNINNIQEVVIYGNSNYAYKYGLSYNWFIEKSVVIGNNNC